MIASDREKKSGAEPPFGEEFLRAQYREMLSSLIDSAGQGLSSERRHDRFLREMVQAGRWDDAFAYLDAMIGFCDEHGLREIARYKAYRMRIGEMRDARMFTRPPADMGGESGE